MRNLHIVHADTCKRIKVFSSLLMTKLWKQIFSSCMEDIFCSIFTLNIILIWHICFGLVLVHMLDYRLVTIITCFLQTIQYLYRKGQHERFLNTTLNSSLFWHYCPNCYVLSLKEKSSALKCRIITQSKIIRGKIGNATKGTRSLLIIIDNAALILKEINTEFEAHIRVMIRIILTVCNKTIKK